MNESHAPLFADVDSDQLLGSLLNASLTGVILFSPVYNSEGLIVDLAYVHLNPTAQSMLGLSSRPAETFLTLYPNTRQTGIFAFYCDTFLSGKPGRYDVNYSYDGLDNYFHLSAQASGSLLIVSFTDTAQQDRSPVEVDLRASQQRDRQNFYQVFEQAPVIIALLQGPQHYFHYCNPAFQALFPGRELTSHLYADVMPEIVAAGLMAELDRVYATGQTYYGTQLPLIVTPPDGRSAARSAPQERYYDFSYQAQRENGQITGISIFAYDVTERVQARQQAEAQRQRLQTLFMQAPAAICILDGPQLVFELVNPVYQQLFPGRSLLGKPLLEALPEIQGQPIHTILEGVYRTGETFEGRELLIPLARQEGGVLEELFFNFIYQARYDQQGQVDGIVVFAYEVTLHVRARQSVEESEQDLRNLVLAAPVGICLLDGPTLVGEVVNESFIEIAGRPVEAIVGKGYWDAFPEARPYYESALQGVVESGEPYYANEVELMLIRHGKEEKVFVTFVYMPMKDSEGKVKKVVVYVLENTPQVVARQRVEASERRAQTLAEELAAANEELQAANEEIQATNDELGFTNVSLSRTNVDLDNFIYTASHDLKAPISNIEGLLSMLLKRIPAQTLLDERIRKLTDLMQDSVERFKQTITHLTEVVKLQKESNPTLSPVDLAKVVREVRLDLAPQLEIAKAVLDVEVDACPNIHFSEKNLRSVVYNLLSNAVKYASPERTPLVKIHCRTEGAFIVLSVSDNGLGLDAAQQTKLFTMFGRLHNHVEGTGVGLYMIKKMVENAAGRIEVESQVGVGSTFRVYFPTASDG